jgi:FkbM family methyltransferase
LTEQQKRIFLKKLNIVEMLSAIMKVLISASYFATLNSFSDSPLKLGNFSEVVVGLDGRFVLPITDEIVSEYIRAYGQYEKPAIDFICSILGRVFNESSNKLIILDVGANLGVWTVPLSKHIGDKGVVYAFDAQRHMNMYLAATLVLNGISNVHQFNKVVSNVTGFTTVLEIDVFKTSMDLKVNYGALSVFRYSQSEVNILKESTKKNVEEAIVENIVENIVLDDFYFGFLTSKSKLTGQNACPSFIKMDIENYELLAIIGAQKMLLECKPLLYFEANCPFTTKSLFLMLTHLGYTLAWVVSPTIYLEKIHNGRVMGLKNIHENDRRDAIFGSINVIAIPKHLENLHNIIGKFPNLLVEIDVKNEKFTIDQYYIRYCLSKDVVLNLNLTDNFCVEFNAHNEKKRNDDDGDDDVNHNNNKNKNKNKNRNVCSDVELPDFFLNYWQRFPSSTST